MDKDMDKARTFLTGVIRPRIVRWPVIALFAIPIAYMDGFWMTALQGVIGAVERSEPPFVRWLRDSTLMLPIVALGVLAALLWGRHLLGDLHSSRTFWGLAIGVALLSAAVGIVEASMSSLIDYRYQVQHLELMHSLGAQQSPAIAGFGSASYYLYCNIRGTLIGSTATAQAAGSVITQLEYATFVVHIRALLLDAALLVMSNLMLSAMALALCGNAIWQPRLTASTDTQPMSGHRVHHPA